MMIELQELRLLREQYRRNHRTVVFTNGCFDILHAGHVRYLDEAKGLGDVLIVGLNSDESVHRLKGAGRPVNPAEDRAEVMSGLRSVDHVVVFGEKTAEELVRQLQPDVYVKGGDYTVDQLPEASAVAAYGGRTVVVSLVPGRSTTNVIRRLQTPAEEEKGRE